MIDVVNPAVAVLMLMLGLSISAMLYKLHKGSPLQEASTRFVSIDGLRGYLAFAVYLHHSCIWYFYLQTGRWEVPPSSLYTMLGQGAVALFFMVTSFLFATKILDSKANRIDWFDFYILRAARLVPLYFLAIAILLLYVGIRTGWVLNGSSGELVGNIIDWLLFTVSGKPDLNGVYRTSIMLSSVTWSLPYEWFAYFCLPLFAVLLTRRLSFGALLFSLVAVYAMLEAWKPVSVVLCSFIGGLAASVIVRYESVTVYLKHPCCSVLRLLLVTALVSMQTAFGLLPLVLLSAIFTIISGGNRLFGLLDNVAARWLGEMSYGVYLLHGLCLFTVFYFVVGIETVRSLSPLGYWLLVACITPFMLVTCHYAHLLIELPAMANVRHFLAVRRMKREKLCQKPG